MTMLTIDGDRAVVCLSGRQSVMALARQVSVPVSAITGVEVVPDGGGIDLGWRVGGTSIPRRLWFGRFRRRGKGRTFAAVYAGEPAVVVRATGADWDKLVVTIADPERVAGEVRAAAGLPSVLQ